MDNNPFNTDSSTGQIIAFILDLFCFFIEKHAVHIKNYIESTDVLRRICLLTKSRQTYLAVCSVRTLRKIIAKKDEFYIRYIIKENCLGPIVDTFVTNSNRYNLLNSTILEMFEFIKKEDLNAVCTYIIENFGDSLLKITYVQTFKTIKRQQDQYKKSMSRLLTNSVVSITAQSLSSPPCHYRKFHNL